MASCAPFAVAQALADRPLLEATLALPDRGEKHVCLRCQTRFYDLKRPQLICPRCGADQVEEAAKIAAATPKKKSRAKAAPVAAPKEEEKNEEELAEEAEAELPEKELDEDEDDEEELDADEA